MLIPSLANGYCYAIVTHENETRSLCTFPIVLIDETITNFIEFVGDMINNTNSDFEFTSSHVHQDNFTCTTGFSYKNGVLTIVTNKHKDCQLATVQIVVTPEVIEELRKLEHIFEVMETDESSLDE